MHARDAKLTDGSEWIDHEGCLVGNAAGLESFIVACETAIECGEYYSSNLGDYVGVKKLDSSWFEDPIDSPQTIAANTALWVTLVFLGAMIVIGIIATIRWVF